MSLPRLFVVGDSIFKQYGPHLERFVASAFAYARKGGPEMAAARGAGLVQDANGGDSAAVLAYLEAVAAAGAVCADVLLSSPELRAARYQDRPGQRRAKSKPRFWPAGCSASPVRLPPCPRRDPTDLNKEPVTP